MNVEGVGPEQPTIINENGGKQSDIPYRMDLIPAIALFKEAAVLKRGAEKYGEENWRNIPINDHLNRCLVHIYAYLAGDTKDAHLVNLSCRAHFALALLEENKSIAENGT